MEQQPVIGAVTLQAAVSLHSLSRKGVQFAGGGGGGVQVAPPPPPPHGGSSGGTAGTAEGNANNLATNPIEDLVRTSADFTKRKASAANRGLHIEINSGTSYATDAEPVHVRMKNDIHVAICSRVMKRYHHRNVVVSILLRSAERADGALDGADGFSLLHKWSNVVFYREHVTYDATHTLRMTLALSEQAFLVGASRCSRHVL